MTGQGSPSPSPGPEHSVFGQWTFAKRGLRTAFLCRCALVLLTFACAQSAEAQQLEARLRIAWGGPTPTQQRLTFSVTEGQLSRLTPLGLESDSPGSIYLATDQIAAASPLESERTSANQVIVDEPSQREYNGFDLTVRAPPSAVLRVESTNPENANSALLLEVSLEDLISQAARANLSDQGHQLIVGRAPGDQLQVETQHDHLLFDPGEHFVVQVTPNQTGISENASLTLKIELTTEGVDDSLWSQEHSLERNREGVLLPIEESIPLPEEEGVYAVQITVREQSSIPIPFVRSEPILSRKIQLAVVADHRVFPTANSDTPIRVVGEFDPTSPRLWERMWSMPQLRIIPGFHAGPLGNGLATQWAHHDRSFMRLEPGAWQAYPIPVGELGRPHVLEIEYPADLRQTLGISILQPNAAGQLLPLGLDSGVDVTRPVAGGTLGRHRLLFWPRSDAPLVLLTNQTSPRAGEEAIAAFGRVRVYALPAELPTSLDAPASQGREILALWDRPLFPENFSAEEALDPQAGRCLDDWRTFDQSATRMVEYLDYTGYSGAIVSVFSEGSTLYPSALLEPTTKHDTGPFFVEGQDLFRKDVLELLLRRCDARGQQLIPQVQFCTPLPQLEQIIRNQPEQSEGIKLVDLSGRSWVEQYGTRQGLAPYYNPLDERVQFAMLRVIDELLQRYESHPSLRGIAVQLSANGYAQLPGILWGCDRRTLSRFVAETGAILDQETPEAVAQALQGPHRNTWLAWRAEQLAQFYRRIQERIAQSDQNDRLYLVPTEWLDQSGMEQRLRPTLPSRVDVTGVLLEMGISLPQLAEVPNLVFYQPSHLEAGRGVGERSVDLRVANDSQLGEQFRNFETPASLFIHRTVNRRLTEFDAVSPYGASNTLTYLAMHAPPDGWENRRRFAHALATSDTTCLAEGGWMLPLGQEDMLRPWFDSFRRLPSVPFTTIEAGTTGGPVVVRTLSHQGERYVYLVNDSPWPVEVVLDLAGATDCQIHSLSSLQLAGVREGSQWRVTLEPYGLVAAQLSSAATIISRYETILPTGAAEQVVQQIANAEARIAELTTLTPLQTPPNAGFEEDSFEGQPPNWILPQGAGLGTRVDPLRRSEGINSLRIESQGEVTWVRSAPIEIPRTGRIAVWVWMRIDDPNDQPEVRLVMDGQAAGQPYYRFARVGAGPQVEPLTAQFAPYVFQIDNLPAHDLDSLRVGIDLMGAGRLWIDQVQVYAMPFSDAERTELIIRHTALAKFLLDEGRLADAARVLETYWPQLLEEQVPLPDPLLARQPDQPALNDSPIGPAPDEPSQPDREANRSVWDRFHWPF